jgi:hypothetical protein
VCVSLVRSWVSTVVGLQSALHQQLVQQQALEQVARDYEAASASEGAARDACARVGAAPLVGASMLDDARTPPARHVPAYAHEPGYAVRDDDDMYDAAVLTRTMHSRRLAGGGSRTLTLDASSVTLEASSADLDSSLRSLGYTVKELLRSKPMDLQTVASAPRALYTLSRRLVPRLAGHVSPTRLLASMVNELNETIAISVSPSTTLPSATHDDASSTLCLDYTAGHELPDMTAALPPSPHTAAFHHTAAPLRPTAPLLANFSPLRADLPSMDLDDDAPIYGRERGVSLPTEEALRQHNELHLAEAAAAAAAVLSRLPVAHHHHAVDEAHARPLATPTRPLRPAASS